MAKKLLDSKQVEKFIEDNNLSIFYRQIPNVKKAALLFNYSNAEIEEIIKCQKDPIYFFEKYCLVRTLDGEKNIVLRDYQKELIQNYSENRYNITVSSRQVGMSLVISLLIVHDLVFSQDKIIGISDRILTNSYEMIEKIKSIYTGLPFYLKPGVSKWTYNELRFDNGMRLTGKKNSSLMYSNTLFVNDFSYFSDRDKKTIKQAIIPMKTVRKDDRVFITLMPFSYDISYELYQDAVGGKNVFHPYKIHWTQVPNRDEIWKKKEISAIGQELFDIEYDLSFINKKCH